MHRAKDLVAAAERDVGRLDVGEVGELGEALLVDLRAPDDFTPSVVGDDGDDAAEDAVLARGHTGRTRVQPPLDSRNDVAVTVRHSGAVLQRCVGAVRIQGRVAVDPGASEL